MVTLETPGGVLTWEGPLRDATPVSVDGRAPIPLERLVALTNGEVLAYLP